MSDAILTLIMSRYLKSKRSSYGIHGALGATGAFAFIKISLAAQSAQQPWLYFIASLLAALCAYFEYKSFQVSDKFSQGIEGEDAVYFELQKLPKAYRVLENVVLPDEKGDIDFIIIGQNGISLVETKSHRGDFTFQNGKLQRKTSPVKKDFVKQVKRQSASLQRTLKNEFKSFFPIHPFIVFSSQYTKLKLGKKPIPETNITAIKLKWLNDCIQEQRGFLSESYIEKITSHLEQFQQK